MTLDIDIGNTRVKWRGPNGRGAMMRAESWQETIDIAYPSLQRLRISSVGGCELAEELASWAQERWGISAEFASTSKEAGGVVCAYDQPEKLGVDRWLGLLAARQKGLGNLLIVDAGSAITVDRLRSDGEHLGGYIVPGLEMQRRALFAGTSDVKVDNDAALGCLEPGRDTESAVRNGCLTMVVSLIERECSVMEGDTGLILTGGDAEYLVKHLSGNVMFEPDLVLDGLSVVLP